MAFIRLQKAISEFYWSKVPTALKEKIKKGIFDVSMFFVSFNYFFGVLNGLKEVLEISMSY